MECEELQIDSEKANGMLKSRCGVFVGRYHIPHCECVVNEKREAGFRSIRPSQSDDP